MPLSAAQRQLGGARSLGEDWCRCIKSSAVLTVVGDISLWKYWAICSSLCFIVCCVVRFAAAVPSLLLWSFLSVPMLTERPKYYIQSIHNLRRRQKLFMLLIYWLFIALKKSSAQNTLQRFPRPRSPDSIEIKLLYTWETFGWLKIEGGVDGITKSYLIIMLDKGLELSLSKTRLLAAKCVLRNLAQPVFRQEPLLFYRQNYLSSLKHSLIQLVILHSV